MDGGEPIRSVLFVDFDNIFSDLGKLNREAAEVFADQPNLWVGWLESGMGGRTRPRRFLVKNMYLNPAAYGTARAVFTRSGFRAIDCPSLTSQGKSSADIHMVLEIVDALRHETQYDEFVIMSADADFTPVLHRLRAHNRRSVVVTAGPAAAAYRSVADHIVWPNDLVTSALALAKEARALVDPEPFETTNTPTTPLPPAGTDELSARRESIGGVLADLDPAPLENVVEAVRSAVAASELPLWSSGAAQAARSVEPRVKELRWYGAGSFRAFATRNLPELEYCPEPSPGFLRDPLRHTEGATPRAREKLAPVLERVALVTDVPRLPQETYRVVFEALVEAVSNHGLDYQTSDAVAAAAQSRGKKATADEVRRIITALVAERVQLNLGVTVLGLQTVWCQYVADLCLHAGLQLSEAELRDVEMWLTGHGSDKQTTA